ncbi:MAG: Ion channel protein [Thermodesulfatator sp.]|nr:MAG: Ion channel protein [Thermodesulfatator sp.]
MKRSFHLAEHFLHRYSFQHLLVWLLLYIVASPFLQSLPHASMASSITMSLILLLAVYAINPRSRMYNYVLILMALTLSLFWLNMLNIVSFSKKASGLIMIAYFSLLVYSFTRYVFSARKVDSRLISAALCLYLIMGTLWGVIYQVLEIFVPGSFKGDLLAQTSATGQSLQHFEYFSFVTLTTLGYGDILPQTQGAASLCQAEAIIGQFYMAVLVARLVGIQVSQKFSHQENRQNDQDDK